MRVNQLNGDPLRVMSRNFPCRHVWKSSLMVRCAIQFDGLLHDRRLARSTLWVSALQKK
ncbi:hypothetical protein Hanom_Chr05g00465421 [Helianthus anomalus]